MSAAVPVQADRARSDPARRTRRWLRIHWEGSQRCDLFHPMADVGDAPAGTWPPGRARLGLLHARAIPDRAGLNGRLVALVDPVRDGDWTWLDVGTPDAALPGENVVGLDTRVDPRAVHLRLQATSQHGMRVGWGSHAAGDTYAPAGADPHIDGAVAFLLASLSCHPHWDGHVISLTAFDPAAGAPRLWSWLWTTALTYEALAVARERWGYRIDLGPLERTLLGRQVRGVGPEVDGSYMVRFDPDIGLPTGVIPWHAPNDGAFLGLHGLLAAHRLAGDARFLAAARDLGNWIVERGMREGRLLVGWDAARGCWDERWLYVDAAWTPAFLQALANATGETRFADAAVAVAQDTIARFSLADSPFYLKIWRADGRHTRTLFARGMAWILEGWLPLIQTGAGWLAPRTERLCAGLIAAQRSDGSFSYLLDRAATGPCNKGTPALACQLLRAARLFPDRAEALRAAASAALRWCEHHQVLEAGSPGRGGIVAQNAEGAIVTRRGIATAFNYGAAYYLLARAEERQ